MKLNVISDCHLEFGPLDVGKGDVLIICGDCVVADELRSSGPTKRRYLKFFEEASENYDQIFYVMGNHEHYDGDILDTVKVVRKWMPPNVTVLDNDCVYYKGYHFIGATMWASFDGGNPIEMLTAGSGLNDYNYIRKGANLLTPQDTLAEHDKTIKFFNEVLPTLKDNVVMITHHAPSLKSIQSDRSKGLKYAYATELGEFIQDNPCIKYWFHGHIHDTNNYKIGDTTIISNPRGYYRQGENPTFDINLTVDLP
jgi:Icc-related predicted phosphoesterase